MLLHSQHRFHHHNSRYSLSPLNLQRLPVVVLKFRTCNRCRWGVLHCTDYCTHRHRHWYCTDYIYRGITKSVFSLSTRQWKPRSQWSLHAPSRATQRFCVSASRAPCANELLHTSTNFLHMPPCAGYSLHAPPCARSAPADVSLRWHHHCHVTCWRHYCHITCWRHRPHLLTSPATSADFIIDFDRWFWLRVDFDRWLFVIVDFCSPGAPYLVFRVDFIFAVYFCIFCF